jgi:hypothetical protein
VAEEAVVTQPGAPLVSLDRAGTVALVLTSVGASLLPDGFALVHAGLSLLLFAVGTGALLWAYGIGIGRSRTDLVDIPGLFLLSGPVAPESTRRSFRAALAVQVVVVVAAASIRPFTEVAFGILAPMYGLGLMALWGARHGAFPPRPPRQPS